MTTFEVRPELDGCPYRVTVVIYDHLEQMRRASAREDPVDPGWYDQALGVTQERDHPDGPAPEHIVTIRLCRGYLSTEIVTHEAAHAAVAIRRQTLTAEDLAADVLITGDELLPTLVGDISYRIVDRLYSAGYYPSEDS